MDGAQSIATDQQIVASHNDYKPACANKLVGIDPQVIIDRIAKGELQREIAAELGVSQPAISWYIKKHVPIDRWRQVKVASIEARLEQVQSDIDNASDMLMLARARESGRLWMWRAEREHGEIWASKAHVDMHITQTDLGDRLRAAQDRLRTVDSTATRVADDPAGS